MSEEHKRYVNWEHLRGIVKDLELVAELLSIYERSEKLDEDQYLWYKKPIDGILRAVKDKLHHYYFLTEAEYRRVI